MENPGDSTLYPMVIGDQLVAGSSGKFVTVINPSSEEVVGRVPAATPEEVDRAVQTAAKAFKVWGFTPAADRAAAMMKFIQAVRANIDDVAQTLTAEQGKPLWQAKGEINGFCAVIEFYAQEARRIQGMVLQSDMRDKFVYVLRHPMGVIAAIPPWNDPLHLLSRMIGPAMAAGCTVVAKPSSDTPLATVKIAQIALQAGFPAGVFNVITGPGGSTGEALTRHPLVRKIAITGSVEGGKQVMHAAADSIKRVTLELGGQCPCIVWKDADLDKAVDSITFQAFRSAGQVCNRVNRVYVHETVYEELVNRVAILASRVVVGDGFQNGVDIGPLVNRKQVEWVSSQVEDAIAKGARVLSGGKPIGDKGFFYAPTVLADCTHEMSVMKEETFGPVLAFMKIGDDLDQAIDYANDTIYGLSSYFFSADARNCYLAAQRLEAGSIWINDIHGSFVQAPYGGMKQSGIGREQGSIAIDDYLEWKTVYQEMSYESRGARACVHHE
jgi:succinate-semialdehyde dehydrogenase / glutarate-semialdehyde dehydrogenase